MEKVDRNGVEVESRYDIHGRKVGIITPEEEITYRYDNNGNLLEMTDGTGTTVRTYDDLSRVLTKYSPGVGTLTFEYDLFVPGKFGFKKEIITDQGNHKSYKIYDKAGRLYQVGTIENGMDTELESYEYDSIGNKERVTRNGSSLSSYEYYDNGLLDKLYNYRDNGSLLVDYDYDYDAVGNQIQKTENKEGVTKNTTYTYDDLNRIESVNESNGKLTSYTYDESGNREFEVVSQSPIQAENKSVEYKYNDQNRLVETIEVKEENMLLTQMNYDYNGNMINSVSEELKFIQSPEETISYGGFVLGQDVAEESEWENSLTVYNYNALNQMVEVVQGDKVSQYSYNGEGYRTKVESGSSITTYAYIGDKVAIESNNSETIRNVYAGNKLVSRTINDESIYYYYNGHGDVIQLYDPDTDTVKAEFDYDAFGVVIKEDNPEDINNPFMYSGYQYDGDTELYYLNARMYDAKIARFMQTDTYLGQSNDPLSLNTYSYNNPIKYWDPTGHIVTQWDKDHLSLEQQNQIAEATEAWNIANKNGNQAAKNEAHDRAERIRDSIRTSSQVGSTDGFTHNVTISTNNTYSTVTTQIYEGDRGYVGQDGYRPVESATTYVENTIKDTNEVTADSHSYEGTNEVREVYGSYPRAFGEPRITANDRAKAREILMGYYSLYSFLLVELDMGGKTSKVEGTGKVDPNNLSYEERQEYIWKYLKNEFGMSDLHAAAIMGNMQVESDFSPTNAQDGYGYPGVDNSDYIDEYEIKDGVGWGLIQWTFYTRKEGLQKYAEQQGKSVGDLNVQLEYLHLEVTTENPYKKRYSEFLEIDDLDTAVEFFCTEIEQAGVPHLDRRTASAENILKKFGGIK